MPVCFCAWSSLNSTVSIASVAYVPTLCCMLTVMLARKQETAINSVNTGSQCVSVLLGAQVTALVRAVLQNLKSSSPDALPAICMAALTEMFEDAEDAGQEEDTATWDHLAGVAHKIAGLYIGPSRLLDGCTEPAATSPADQGITVCGAHADPFPAGNLLFHQVK